MNTILEMILSFLESDVDDATDFSIALENALCDYYDQMYADNPTVTEILNEELPDICANYCLGDCIDTFKERINKEYQKVLTALTRL